MMVDAFLPSNLASVTISVGAAATSTLLPVGTVPGLNPWRSGGEFLEVNNAGAVDVFIETSDGSVVATVAASYPVRAGQCKIIRRAQGDRFISAIGAAAGPANLIVTVGNGI